MLPAPPFSIGSRVVCDLGAGTITHCSPVGYAGYLVTIHLDSGQHVTARSCNVSHEEPAAELIPMPRRFHLHLATLNGAIVS